MPFCSSGVPVSPAPGSIDLRSLLVLSSAVLSPPPPGKQTYDAPELGPPPHTFSEDVDLGCHCPPPLWGSVCLQLPYPSEDLAM